MGNEAREVAVKRTSFWTLDVWAVLLAFVLALLVRFGVLQHVAW
jgi:hypothetical protein